MTPVGDACTALQAAHGALWLAQQLLRRPRRWSPFQYVYLQEMVKPGLLAVLSPCVVGLTFRVIGAYTGQTLLGAKAVAGLLIFTTVAGTLITSPKRSVCILVPYTPTEG